MTSPEHDVVTGVLVRDGRVLLCHRHPNREWYPNVWDLPGGHVDAGESPVDAVTRELAEELGISVRLDTPSPFRTLRPSPDLRLRVWMVTDWDGEVRNTALEEHDEVGWFAADELAGLDLADDQLRELLVDVLAANSSDVESDVVARSDIRQHLTVVFDESDLADIVELRHRWDPVMAAGVPPHLTVVYPEEVGDFDVLVDRARRHVPLASSFSVRLGSVFSVDGGAGGVFVEAHDDSGTLAALRSGLLERPAGTGAFRSHVTVLHARTSNAGVACWEHLEGWSADVDVAVRQVAWTHTNQATGMQVVETFDLRTD